MDAETFFASFEAIAEAPGGVAHLRQLIIDQAVAGRLVPQVRGDEPARELLPRIKELRDKAQGATAPTAP